MFRLERCPENPILSPRKEVAWEAEATFNGSVVKAQDRFYLIYRALSSQNVSSIGCAVSNDGIHFTERYQLIKPEERWEQFGCEDPRVTKLDGKYYIFYTALSTFPFSAEGIKIGLAITKDLKRIECKHQITTFNSKAMALFPERINGKLTAILTVHTDKPPAKIAIASFDREEELWSSQYWRTWYDRLDEHVIPLLRSTADHLEVGAPPVKTPLGWLLIYSYIENYFSPARLFTIEGLLLDLKNPLKLLARTPPLLFPEKEYELKGKTPNVVFPSGALIAGNKLLVYYGAADSTCCLASTDLKELLKQLHALTKPKGFIKAKTGLERFAGNPILVPRPEFGWEAKAVFNPGAIYIEKVHLIYRAMSMDNTSVFGYASSLDGLHIDERLPSPVYVPRESFESKTRPGNSGCEDARLTRLDDTLYMLYTAFDGITPRVALTSIKVQDFLAKRWNWKKPVVISPPNISDKNACLFPKKIKGKYAILHRIGESIQLTYRDSLDFKDDFLDYGKELLKPRPESWDNYKVGAAAPPIETKDGWLLIYHGVSQPGMIYRLGAALLDLHNPEQLLYRSKQPILEPLMDYEKLNQTSNVVFSCGAVLLRGQLLVYYGAADKVIAVARTSLDKLLKELKR